MSEYAPNERRRRFLRTAAGVATVPVVGIAGPMTARADMPRLDPSSERAQGFNYVHDANEAGNARQEGAICGNCLHWTGGDAQWGGCNIFPEHLVNRDGWCSAWVQG